MPDTTAAVIAAAREQLDAHDSVFSPNSKRLSALALAANIAPAALDLLEAVGEPHEYVPLNDPIQVIGPCVTCADYERHPVHSDAARALLRVLTEAVGGADV